MDNFTIMLKSFGPIDDYDSAILPKFITVMAKSVNPRQVGYSSHFANVMVMCVFSLKKGIGD